MWRLLLSVSISHWGLELLVLVLVGLVSLRRRHVGFGWGGLDLRLRSRGGGFPLLLLLLCRFLLLHRAFHGESRAWAWWRDDGQRLVLMRLLGCWSLVRRSVEIVVCAPAVLVLVLEGMVPEVWVSHQPTPHRTAGSAASALLEIIHSEAAAIVVESRH